MDEDKTVVLTPAQRAATNDGGCVAILCPERCEFFAYNFTQDSFRICVCGHTQHAHSRGAVQ